ncbi:MAG: hypothetical protein RLZZ174_1748 [Pseudomonadota bacterium]
MSVELLNSPRFYGYRVRRQIDGRTFQEYFSLKKDGKRIRGPERAALKVQAEERDQELKALQQKSREGLARRRAVDEKGRVRGVLFRLKQEKSGTQTPVFQVGIHSFVEQRIVNTTVSISRHGLTGAWRRAIDFYALHKKIGPRSKAYKSLLDACPSEGALKKLLKEGASKRQA